MNDVLIGCLLYIFVPAGLLLAAVSIGLFFGVAYGFAAASVFCLLVSAVLVWVGVHDG